jgi:hypothetical protein
MMQCPFQNQQATTVPPKRVLLRLPCPARRDECLFVLLSLVVTRDFVTLAGSSACAVADVVPEECSSLRGVMSTSLVDVIEEVGVRRLEDCTIAQKMKIVIRLHTKVLDRQERAYIVSVMYK